MHLYVLPNRYIVAHGADLVMLDARVGVYSIIAGAAEFVTIEDAGGALATQDVGLADALIASGAAALSPVPRRVAALPLSPSRSALDKADIPLGFGRRIETTAAWADMFCTYYGRSFAELIKVARSTFGRTGATQNNDDLASRAVAFEQLSPWIPFQGDCLFRSFMLLRQLRWSGYRPQWVFGVRTWPFYAHCWLQQDDMVLTDFVETLTNFTPIMSV